MNYLFLIHLWWIKQLHKRNSKYILQRYYLDLETLNRLVVDQLDQKAIIHIFKKERNRDKYNYIFDYTNFFKFYYENKKEFMTPQYFDASRLFLVRRRSINLKTVIKIISK